MAASKLQLTSQPLVHLPIIGRIISREPYVRAHRAFMQAWHIFLLIQTRQYRATFLGILWMFTGPLTTLLPIILVANAMKLEGGEEFGIPYSLFSFSGVILWQVFWGGVHGVHTIFHPMRKRIRVLQLDATIPVFGAAFGTILSTWVSFMILPIMMWRLHYHPSITVLLFPIPVLVAFLAGCCVGLPLLMLNSIYQDVRHSMGFIHQFLFWTLPVVHVAPAAGKLYYVMKLNPLSHCFDFWRGLFSGNIAEYVVPFSISAGIILVLFLIVLRFYRNFIWEAVNYVL